MKVRKNTQNSFKSFLVAFLKKNPLAPIVMDEEMMYFIGGEYDNKNEIMPIVGILALDKCSPVVFLRSVIGDIFIRKENGSFIFNIQIYTSFCWKKKLFCFALQYSNTIFHRLKSRKLVRMFRSEDKMC